MRESSERKEPTYAIEKEWQYRPCTHWAEGADAEWNGEEPAGDSQGTIYAIEGLDQWGNRKTQTIAGENSPNKPL